MENKVITLRSVYGKMKEYHFQPGRQANGIRFPWVKPVRYDSMGNSEMILSTDEMNDPNRDYFIPEDMDITIVDGTTFDLSNPLQYNIWMSIKDSDLIVPSRDSRDSNGVLFIDGDKRRYGMAEIYVDVPGEESERSVSKKQKITKAWTYIGADSKNGRLTKCKILGKYMNNAPDSDVEDYLYQRAEKNPDEIIDLYTSGDMSLRLLILDAETKGLLIFRDGMYYFADTILGSTRDGILEFFKKPFNKRILDQIKVETYPEYASMEELSKRVAQTEPDPVVETPVAPKGKTTAKK